MNPEFLNITTIQEFNPITAQPGIEVQLRPGFDVSTHELRIKELERQVSMLITEQETTINLIQSNPGLKDLYEKYQVMLLLVKNND